MRKIDLKKTLLNNKKIVILMAFIFIILIGLLFNKITSIDNYKDDIKVAKVSMKRLTANATEITNDIKSFDKITYNVKYTLKGKNGESATNRIAIIIADITEDNLKYASWNLSTEKNVTSEIINDGKTLKLTITGVDTDKEYTTPISLSVTGAPNGYSFNPTINVNESTNTDTAESTNTTSKVSTLSISGVAIDSETKEQLSNVELLLCKVQEDNTCKTVTTIFTKEDGSYVFGDLEDGTYKVSLVNNSEYETSESDDIVITNESKIFNINLLNNGEFHAKVDKYVKKIEVTENGEKKSYDYNNLNKAVLAVKNIKNVEAKITYEFTIINIGSKEGFVKVVKEDIPEGLIFNKEYEENKNWVEDNGILYNKTLSDAKLKVGESKTLTITLDLKNQQEAKTYLNKVIITGESYHTVVFVSDDKIIKQQEVLDSDKINSISTTKEGYTFDGWYTDTSYKTKFDFNSPILKDTAIYAKLTKNAVYYDIKFIDEGKDYYKTKAEEGKPITDIPTNPSKEGYTFDGWSTNSTCKGENYDFNTPTKLDLTLYSCYEKNKEDAKIYTATFKDPDGNTYDEYTQSVTEGGTISKPELDPILQCKDFDHWSETKNGEPYNFNEVLTGNKVLYAVFSDSKLTLTYKHYDSETGEEIKWYETSITCGSKPDTPSKNPTEPGKEFDKWVEPDGTPLDPDDKITEDKDYTSTFKDMAMPLITHKPTEWTKNSVIVSMSIPDTMNIVNADDEDEVLTIDKSKYSLEYSIDNGEYVSYEKEFTINENCNVKGRLSVIKTTEKGNPIDHPITNIDKINPNIISLNSSNLTQTGFTLNMKVKDNESGIGTIKIYKDDNLEKTYTYSTLSQEEATQEILESYIFEELFASTTYKIYIEVYDRVENLVTSEEMDVTTNAADLYIAQIIGRSDTLFEEGDYEKYQSLNDAIESCGDAQCTIQMLDNTTESNTIGENQNITIDLNSKSVSSDDTQTLLNNGQLIVIDNSEDGLGNISNTTAIAVNNIGTFTLGNNDEIVSITTPAIDGITYGLKTTGTFNFYDGKINGNIAISGYVHKTPINYNAVISYEANQAATLAVTTSNEARINTTYYLKLSDAVKNVDDNETITVLKDIQLLDPISFSKNINVTLDLNNYTIQPSIASTSNFTNYIINNNGTLTINDSSDNSDSSTASLGYIKSGKVTADIIKNTNNLIINAGDIGQDDYNSSYQKENISKIINSGDANIKVMGDANVGFIESSSNGNIEILGGNISNLKISNSPSNIIIKDADISNFNSDSYSDIDIFNSYVRGNSPIIINNIPSCVNKINANNINITDSFVKNGCLSGKVEVSNSNIEFATSGTLNSTNSYNKVINNNGNIDIEYSKDGSINNLKGEAIVNNSVIDVINSGNINIDTMNGTIENEGTLTGKNISYSSSGEKLSTILKNSNGTMELTNVNYDLKGYSNYIIVSSAPLTLNNMTLTIGNSRTNIIKSKSDLNINDSNIISNVDSALFEVYGTTTIENSILSSGGNGISNYGELNFISGSLNSNNIGISNDNLSYSDVESVVNLGNNSDEFNYENPLITTGKEGIINNSIFNFYDGKIVSVAKTITGEITSVLNGKNIKIDVKNIDSIDKNVASLEDFEDILQIGGTKYKTFQNAFDAANDSEKTTITLLKDITEIFGGEISGNKDIIFDINGHSIKYIGASSLITNKGNIKIIDSSINSYQSGSKTIKGYDSDGNYYNYTISINETGNINFVIVKTAIDGTITTSNVSTTVTTLNNDYTDESGNIINTKVEKDNENNVININQTVTYTDDIIMTFTSTMTMYATGTSNVSLENQNSSLLVNSGSGILEVNGGTYNYNNCSSAVINTSDGTLKMSGGIINANKKGIINTSTGTILMTSGTININDSYPTNGIGISNESIGTVDFKDGNINILGSYTIGIYSNGLVNMNGGIIKTADGVEGYEQKGITNNGRLVINDGTINIAFKYYSNREQWPIENNAALVVNGGNTGKIYNWSNVEINSDFGSIGNIYNKKINSGQSVLNLLNGKVNYIINDGIANISGGNIMGITNHKDATINYGVKDGIVSQTNPSISYVSSSSASVEIATGGIFNFYDGIIKGSTAISGAIKEIEEGYDLIKTTENGVETAILQKSTPLVQLESNQKEYYNFNSAINDAISGDTITLLRAPTFFQYESLITVPSDRNLTFDLSGYTISATNDELIENNGTLIIKNGNISSTASKVIENNGNLTINGTRIEGVGGTTIVNNEELTVENKGYISNTISMTNSENATFTIDGASVNSTILNDSTNECFIKNSSNISILQNFGTKVTVDSSTVATIKNSQDKTINMENSKFTSIANDGLMTLNNTNNGSITNSATGIFVINNSSTKSVSNRGNFTSNNTKFVYTITETMKGYSCVHNYGGIINITGGEIYFSSESKDGSHDGYIKDTTILYYNFAYLSEGGTTYLEGVKISPLGASTLGVGLVKNSEATLKNLNIDLRNYPEVSSEYYKYKYNLPIAICGSSNVIVSGGTIASAENDKYSSGYEQYVISNNESTVTVKDGANLLFGKGLKNLANSTMNIEDATVNGVMISNDGTLNIGVKDGIYTSNTNPSITVRTLYNNSRLNFYDGIIIGDIRNGINEVEDGYVLHTELNSSSVNETTLISEEYIHNKNQNLNYSSFTKAINDSQNGDTLIFTKDETIPISSSINIDSIKDITIDLNGKRIELTNSITNNGILKFVDSSDDSSGILENISQISDCVIDNKNKLTIESGNYNINDGEKQMGVIKTNINSITNITGGMVYSSVSEIPAIYGEEGIINVDGGIVRAAYKGIILKEAELNLISGSIKGNYSVYIQGNGSFNMSGGYLTVAYDSSSYSGTGVYISGNCSPIINMSGGSIPMSSYGIYTYGEYDSNYGQTLYPNPIINIIGGSINAGSSAVYLYGGGTLNLGTKDSVAHSTPTLFSDGSWSYTISNNSVSIYDSETSQYINKSGIINYYDGTLKGKTGKVISSEISDKEDNYIINNSSDGTYETITLVLDGAVANVIKMNGQTYQSIQEALPSCESNTECNMILQRNYILNENVTIPADKTINFYTNGYTFSYGDYTISGDGTFNLINGEVPSGLLASIKTLLNIDDGNYVRKNIILSMMDNGENLSAANTYKLQVLDENKFEDVSIKEDINDVGRYTIDLDSKTYDMKTINGKLYLNKMPAGDYKLIDNNKNELIFKINDDGKLSGNIKENYKTSEDTSTMSSATAQVMTAIQTGVTVRNYFLIFLTSILGFVALILINRKIEREQQ